MEETIQQKIWIKDNYRNIKILLSYNFLYNQLFKNINAAAVAVLYQLGEGWFAYELLFS